MSPRNADFTKTDSASHEGEAPDSSSCDSHSLDAPDWAIGDSSQPELALDIPREKPSSRPPVSKKTSKSSAQQKIPESKAERRKQPVDEGRAEKTQPANLDDKPTGGLSKTVLAFCITAIVAAVGMGGFVIYHTTSTKAERITEDNLRTINPAETTIASDAEDQSVQAVAVAKVPPNQPAKATEGFTVSVVKLTIADFPELVGSSTISDSEGSYNLGTCTRVSLLVRTELYRIVGINKELFRWGNFEDGNNVSLLSDQPETLRHHLTLSVSKDRKVCMVDLYVPKVPTAGSSSFKVECDLYLNCGALTDQTIDEFRLAEGEIISAGSMQLSVVRVSQQVEGFGAAIVNDTVQAGRDMNAVGGANNVTGTIGTLILKSERPLDELNKVAILDSDGVEVTGGITTRAKFGTGGETLSLGLKKRLESGKVIVTYLQNVKPVRIPIDLDFTDSLKSK